MFELLRRPAPLDEELSAYLDGELGPARQGVLLERLALDGRVRAAFELLRRTDEVVRQAAAPSETPAPDAAAERLLASLERRPASPAVARQSAGSGGRAPHLLRPVLIASAGLLVTAGLAYVELRRRNRR